MNALGINSDLSNLSLALGTIYPQVTPEGRAFLNIFRDRLCSCAEQVRQMETHLLVPTSEHCRIIRFPQHPVTSNEATTKE